MAEKKKKNVFKRFFKYIRECFGELRKITWPTFGTTTKNFGIVLLVILIAGVFIFALDQGLYALLGLINIESNFSSALNATPATTQAVTEAVTQAATTASEVVTTVATTVAG